MLLRTKHSNDLMGKLIAQQSVAQKSQIVNLILGKKSQDKKAPGHIFLAITESTDIKWYRQLQN